MKIQTFTGPLEPWIRTVERILTHFVEFGHPAHPLELTSTLAGDNTAVDSHNGLLDNVRGSWVEVEVEALDTPVVCNHNLGLTITDIDGNGDPTPNVRWLFFAWQHDGARKEVYEDLRGPAGLGQIPPGVANPSWVPAFTGPPSTIQYLQMSGTVVGPPPGHLYYYFQLPHGYVQGSPILPHVHWTPTDANVGDVYWELEFTNASPGAAFFNPPLITFNQIAGIGGAVGVPWLHSVTALPPIVAPAATISEFIACRITRDQTNPLDTYAALTASDVAFLGMDLHLLIDSHGSGAEYVKADPWGMEEGPFSCDFRRADGVIAADAVTANSIELRFYSPWRLVDEDHPLKATLFFIPAVRG